MSPRIQHELLSSKPRISELANSLFNEQKIPKIFREEIVKEKREYVKKRRREDEELLVCVFRNGRDPLFIEDGE